MNYDSCIVTVYATKRILFVGNYACVKLRHCFGKSSFQLAALREIDSGKCPELFSSNVGKKASFRKRRCIFVCARFMRGEMKALSRELQGLSLVDHRGYCLSSQRKEKKTLAIQSPNKCLHFISNHFPKSREDGIILFTFTWAPFWVILRKSALLSALPEITKSCNFAETVGWLAEMGCSVLLWFAISPWVLIQISETDTL